MSDLRERLAAAWAQFYYFTNPSETLASLPEEPNRRCYEVADAFLPLVEAELAQATADALEAAKRVCEEAANRCEGWARPSDYIAAIEALTAPDIAAKA